MNLDGLMARILQNGTVSALVALGLVFVVFLAFMANGMTGAARRSAMLLVVTLSIIGAIAILAFLFPALSADVINRLSWLWGG